MKWIKSHKKIILNVIVYLTFIFIVIPRIYIGEYQWHTLWIILGIFLVIFCWIFITSIIEVKKDIRSENK